MWKGRAFYRKKCLRSFKLERQVDAVQVRENSCPVDWHSNCAGFRSLASFGQTLVRLEELFLRSVTRVSKYPPMASKCNFIPSRLYLHNHYISPLKTLFSAFYCTDEFLENDESPMYSLLRHNIWVPGWTGMAKRDWLQCVLFKELAECLSRLFRMCRICTTQTGKQFSTSRDRTR